MGESDKLRNSSIWKYLTEYILDVIKDPDRGMQVILTPQKVASWQSMRRQQEHQHLTILDPKHNSRVMPRSVPGRSVAGFGYSSGYSSVSPSDNPTKYDSTVQIIIKPGNVPSDNQTKDT